MPLTWRYATNADLDLLAGWNYQLIHDEGSRNPMTVEQLVGRMRIWLKSEYRALIFAEEEAPVGYALYKEKKELIHLRQLFVRRERRRAGIGRAVMAVLREEIWPSDIRLTVDVLCANHAAVAFWRKVGYRDYALTLEIGPQ